MVKSKSGKSPSVLKGILTGIGAALIWTLAATGITAKLVDIEWIDLNGAGHVVWVMLMVSGFLASWISGRGMMKGDVLWSLAAPAGYFLLLLFVNGLLFGGDLYGVPAALGAIMLGIGIHWLTARAGKGSGKRRRYKIPRG